MDRGRRGSNWAVAGLRSVCIAGVGLVTTACGDSFTTAPADAGAPEASTTGGWCTSLMTTHTFCEDFSSGVPDMLATMPTGGGAIVADTSDFTSYPQSLLATTPSLTATNGVASATASRSFPNSMESHFVLSLDLKIDSACLPENDHNPVSVLAIQFPNSTYSVTIQVLPHEIDAVEMLLGQPQVTKFQMNQPAGWVRWSLDIRGPGTLGANAAVKKLTLMVGSAVFKQDLQKAPAFALMNPTLVVGAAVKNLSDTSPACKVHADNITFDVGPL